MSGQAPTFRALPRAAQLTIPAAIIGAASATVAARSVSGTPDVDVALLVIVGVLCAAASLFEVVAPGNYSFQPNLVFFFWGAVLLPAWCVPVLAMLSFVPAAALRRTRWYMTGFNAANYTLAGIAGGLLAGAGSDRALSLGGEVALAAAAVVTVAVNHILLASIISAAQRRRLVATERHIRSSIPLDFALTLTGACLAALWQVQPGLTVLAVGPMVLVYRALLVPALRHKTRTDPKTRLYNFEHFAQELDDALLAAGKRGEPVAVVMVDLDHLRVTNNRHGHLAGDAAILHVADAIRAIGDDCVAARFGGEEFCVMAPGLDGAGGQRLGERIRARVAAEPCVHEGASIAVSVSVGVAASPEHGTARDRLVSAADAALYDAKVGGRNRVRLALPPAADDALRLEDLPLASVAPLHAADAQARDAAPPEAEPEPVDAPGETPEPAADLGAARPRTRRLVPPFVTVLLGLAAAVALLQEPDAILGQPGLFALLITVVLVLDVVRIDLFDRANISPASAPTLALACVFGPLGPITGEAAIALVRCIRREPTIKWAFDFGALSLSGAAAAAAFAVMPTATVGEMLLAGPVAGLVYYAVNVALLSLVMALSEGSPPVAICRERLAWLWPHYLTYGVIGVGLVAAHEAIGSGALALFALPLQTVWVAQKQYVDRSRSSVAELRRSHAELAASNDRLERLLDEKRLLLQRVQRSYLSTITSLARTIEAKDPYTGGHTERVSDLTLLLARELGVSGEELRAIEVGAIIHDIGKIGIPDSVLLKPGRLDDDEFAQMRKHPEISSYIVAELDLPPAVKQIVRSHHERFDGRGYPDGLAGEEIPLPARILTVADTLDAMTSDRPYRKAMPLSVAVAEVEKLAGAQFCPTVVAALRRYLERDPTLESAFPGVFADAA